MFTLLQYLLYYSGLELNPQSSPRYVYVCVCVCVCVYVCMHTHICVLSCFSHAQLFAMQWTAVL